MWPLVPVYLCIRSYFAATPGDKIAFFGDGGMSLSSTNVPRTFPSTGLIIENIYF
jgi:hypothetical protein